MGVNAGVELLPDRIFDRSLEWREQKRELDVEPHVGLADVKRTRHSRPPEGDMVAFPDVFEIEALLQVAGDLFRGGLGSFVVETVTALDRDVGHERKNAGGRRRV